MKAHHQHLKFRYLVNSYGRDPFYVRRCLKSILEQKFVHEIVFVDQNESPIDISDIGDEHSPITKIHFKNKSVSSARNQIPLSANLEHSWIIFCDDDGHLDKNYSENLMGTLILNPKAKIIAGSIIREDNEQYYSPRHGVGGDLNKFRHSKLLMGSNFCINEKTFHDLGKFSSGFGIGDYWGSAEETDLAWKGHFNNTPMLYDKTLRIYHVKPNFGPLQQNVKKSFKYGVGKGALVIKWLFIERKTKVILELFEMLAIPFIKTIYLTLKLDFRSILFPISSFAGRIYGMLKAIRNFKKLMS